MVHKDLPAIEFTAHDRCDGCGAQAHAMATRENFELLFCIHHLRKANGSLLEEGWEVIEDWEAIEALYSGNNSFPIPA